ncbi:MAG: HU family DNA-binding protein [Christensenellaceae bacterium]|jgi:DNA-binding protein HU-beta|nr:HU family DNA-binding protein [Christensenellaceae bacterium]
MNKKELVKSASAKSKLTQKETLNCLNAITEIIYDTLKRGEAVRLLGFGKFEVRGRAERVSVNPVTKQKMIIPHKLVPSFKTGKAFKSAIR